MDLVPHQKTRVAVIGAGVIGLSTALNLTRSAASEQLDITIIADKFTPEIVSDKASMIMLPVRPDEHAKDRSPQQIAGEVPARFKKWARDTFSYYHSLYSSTDNAEVQLCLRSGYQYQYSHLPDPWWKEVVFGFRHVDLNSEEARMIHTPSNCVDVWAYTTYIMETTPYLKWLTDKIQQSGVRLVKKKVNRLDELTGYDIIINCTGLGSRELVNDLEVKPGKGQLVIARAPWITHFFINHVGGGDFWHIHPRADDVVMGGTYDVNDWNEAPDPNTTETIIKGCVKCVPSASKADIKVVWAGLRPARDSIRLDSNYYDGPSGSLMIHCYGHGGLGFTVGWGCACEVKDIVEQHLSSIKSKL